jgi:hypothetical protein
MTARIYKPQPSKAQSGKAATRLWVLTYEPETPLEIEPLMGWTSSRDMNRQVTLRFATMEEAVAYAERNNIPYHVEMPKPVAPKVFSYADNFKSSRRGQWTH